jgi:hypothetical protein
VPPQRKRRLRPDGVVDGCGAVADWSKLVCYSCRRPTVHADAGLVAAVVFSCVFWHPGKDFVLNFEVVIM